MLCAFALLHASGAGAAPEVVVSIKPIHALVAGVMGDAGEPRLIVPGAASPHTYQMRPSEAAALHAADLVVWVGEALETFLAGPVANLGSGAEILTLYRAAGMRLLRNRRGGTWSEGAHTTGHGEDDHAPGHDEGDHAPGHGEDDHAPGHDEDDHTTGHDEDASAPGHDEGAHAAGHDEHDHAPGHGEIDMHVWLDPHNARRMVDAVAASLARLDPERAATYRQNAASTRARIDVLERSLRVRLAPVRSRSFVVFHDGYQYFERAFGLNGAGALTLGPSRLPGAKRLASLRRALVEREVRCMFIEPQFEPRLAHSLVASTGVRTATLDPLGTDLEAGPDAWFEILRHLGDGFADCLGGV